MPVPNLSSAKRVVAEPETTPTRAAGLVRELVHHFFSSRTPSTFHELDGEPQEFLVDAEVDGLRLILIRPRPFPVSSPVLLSPREREIARMVAKGYPNKTIAAVLDISSWTVGTYLRRIFAKLNVASRAAMVARLVEEGICSVRDHDTPLAPRRGQAPIDPLV